MERLTMKKFKICLRSRNTLEILDEYECSFIPAVRDTIVNKYGERFIVETREFSIENVDYITLYGSIL
jgi:hypothetical protein